MTAEQMIERERLQAAEMYTRQAYSQLELLPPLQGVDAVAHAKASLAFLLSHCFQKAAEERGLNPFVATPEPTPESPAERLKRARKLANRIATK